TTFASNGPGGGLIRRRLANRTQCSRGQLQLSCDKTARDTVRYEHCWEAEGTRRKVSLCYARCSALDVVCGLLHRARLAGRVIFRFSRVLKAARDTDKRRAEE